MLIFRLWHQLSVTLDEFLTNRANCRNNSFVEVSVFLLFYCISIFYLNGWIVFFLSSKLYDEFISKFEARLSPIRLAQVVSVIGHSIHEPEEGVRFFSKVLTSRSRLGIEASLCLDMDVVLMKLKAGLASEAKEMLEEGLVVLSGISSSESFVFSKYYKSSSEFRKVS